MILLDDRRTLSVATLDGVCEPILDPRIDLELRDPARSQAPFDSGDERPDQTLPPVHGIDQDV